MSIISIGIRLNMGGQIGPGIGRIQVFMRMCGGVSSRRIGLVNLTRIWRLESDPIDAVRKLTASYVLGFATLNPFFTTKTKRQTPSFYVAKSLSRHITFSIIRIIEKNMELLLKITYI